MITKAMVERGYDAEIIRIVNSPLGDGAVCAIGDNWFYFGGITAEECRTAVEYIKMVPRKDIVCEIFEVLEDFRKDRNVFEDEYRYYEYYLEENGIHDQYEHEEEAE